MSIFIVCSYFKFCLTPITDHGVPQVTSTGSVHQLNSSLMLLGSLPACHQVVVGASTATLVGVDSLRTD